MKTLNISRFKSTELNPTFTNIPQILLPDAPFDSGAYGEVYQCEVNGIVQVVKIFKGSTAQKSYNTIINLQDAVIKYNQKLKNARKKPIEEINALWALPLFSFNGKLNNGLTVFGYSTYMLDKNWMNFDKMFSEETPKDERKRLQSIFYENITPEIRINFIHDLLEGFLVLEKMNFVYADLNPKNFFIDISNGKLCLIDYDSGAVNDEPETIGKHGDWLAPEIENGERTTSNLFTDYWSVAMTIHYFYFPFQPFFYLKGQNKKLMTEYFAKQQYPEISKRDKNFYQGKEKKYDAYIEYLNNNISPEIIKAFKHVFNDGYFDGGARLTSEQWFKTVKPLVKAYIPPKINVPIINSGGSIGGGTSVSVVKNKTLFQKINNYIKQNKKKVLIFCSLLILVAATALFFANTSLFNKQEINKDNIALVSTIDFNNVIGTYTVIKKDNEINTKIQFAANITHINGNEFAILFANDQGQQEYKFFIHSNSSLECDELGNGNVVYNSSLNETVITFTKNNIIWELTK